MHVDNIHRPVYRNLNLLEGLLFGLSASLLLLPVNLLGLSALASISPRRMDTLANLGRFLLQHQPVLYTLVTAAFVAGSALVIVGMGRSHRRFANWLTRTYPGIMEADDAALLSENLPVIKASGIYRVRARGLLYNGLQVVREELPQAA